VIRCRAGNRCWEGRLRQSHQTLRRRPELDRRIRPMAFSLSHTSPSEWKYISEGIATVVFSYNGPHHLIFTGRVLRLRKVPREGHGPPHFVSDDNPVAFQQTVVSRLLDPSYLPDLQTIPLQSDWVEALSIHHDSFRPQERRSASVIDCTRQTGVLASDLIGGLSCAVEVKVNNYHPPEVPVESFSKSQNGASYLIATIYHQQASLSKLKHAGPACMFT
jgi:hypothetical protein